MFIQYNITKYHDVRHWTFNPNFSSRRSLNNEVITALAAATLVPTILTVLNDLHVSNGQAGEEGS
jgi:hypothetical protein